MTELDIFAEALNFTDLSARADYLRSTCVGNEPLRKRIEELLRFQERSGCLLERGAPEVMNTLFSSPGDTAEKSESDTVSTMALLQTILQHSDQPNSLGRLSHYEVVSIVGRGGYGIVVKAFDESLQRFVALKILSPHLAITSAPRKRFLREARSAAAMQHENLVQIFAVEESPVPYLAMEFIAGETLQQRLDRMGPLDVNDVISIGEQIALGLAEAHAKGLIHRDIKPANILIRPGPRTCVKITDFGLARAIDDASMSESGQFVGTPMYMSPEQLSGEPLDHRSDLFSLGSVLYTLCAGHPPFRAPNTFAVFKRILEDHPRPLRDVIPEIPESLCAVISRLHAKSPKHRFASGGDAAAAIASCVNSPSSRNDILGFRKRMAAISAMVLIPAIAGMLLLSGYAANRLQPRETPSADAQISHRGTASDSERVATLSVDEQDAAVRMKLMELNPQLPAESIQLETNDGVIAGVKIEPSQNLYDTSPLHVLSGVRRVKLHAADGGPEVSLKPLKEMKLEAFESVGHRIHDLSPLQGMPLEIVGLWNWSGDDISPLRGMALTACNLGASPLRDLEPLRGMPLKYLCVNYTNVNDLSALGGMPLVNLEIENTSVSSLAPVADAPLSLLAFQHSLVTDISMLKGKPLKIITLNYDEDRDRSILESMPLLEMINHQPAAEFLKANSSKTP